MSEQTYWNVEWLGKQAPHEPLFSIVTVTMNAERAIKKTALSIREQDFVDFEWIVVDGDSSDGTVEFIKQYLRPSIDVLISESDDGLYYAMNKGLERARGKYVNFLNAGDTFFDSNTLSLVSKAAQDNADVIYGDSYLRLVDDDLLRLRIAGDVQDSIQRGMPFSHQAMFTRREAHLKFPFNTHFRIAADYGAIAAIYESGATFHYIRSPLNENTIEKDAVSIQGKTRGFRECFDIETSISSLSKAMAVRNYANRYLKYIAVRFLRNIAFMLPRNVRARLY